MGERLFTPRSLERVAESVEWEDDLVWYRDGTTNQQRYVQTMSVLWERWMRGWSLPDFAYAVQIAGGGNLLQALEYLLSSVPERIQQIKGFYEGLWAGANPELVKSVVRSTFGSQGVPGSLDQAMFLLQAFLLRIRSIVSSIKGVPNE